MIRTGLAAAAILSLAATVLGGALPANAAEQVSAVGSWSMVPQSKDANDDGIIDGDGGVPRRGATSLTPSDQYIGAGNHIAQPNERLIGGSQSWYLSGRGFPVRLDACESTGSRFRWRVRSATDVVVSKPWSPLTANSCATTIFLPEATYALELEVKSAGARDTTTIQAAVRNVLVVALGDSYASGEGNPRNVAAWVRAGTASSFQPYWDDEDCHRSARGAPAQAALLLEQASPKTSVTLVDVSCSGATVGRGVLGAQTSARQATSQIEQARAIVGDRTVDLVTLSVGGNDVGFTSVLEACALNTDCPLTRASRPPLSAYPTLQDGLQAQTAAVAKTFPQIAACLGGATCTLTDGRRVTGLRLDPQGSVLPTLYPDVTRAANGQPCTYFTIAAKDFAWARQTVLNPAPTNPYSYPLARGGSVNLSVANGSLNQQIAATGSLAGWHPITKTWSASGDSAAGHGVCAGAQAWVFGAALLSAMPSAAFHPNIEGQAVLAAAIAEAMAGAERGRMRW